MTLERLRPLVISALAWVASTLYAVSPADLIPDIIPLIGWADDAVTLCMAVVITLYSARRRALRAVTLEEQAPFGNAGRCDPQVPTAS